MSIATMSQKPHHCSGCSASGKDSPHSHTPAITAPPKPQVREPDAEELEWLQQQSLALEDASPEEILTWAVEKYHPKLTMATAFGPEGCLILSMLAKIEPEVYIFNLDTGYQFQETLDLRDRMAAHYGMEIVLEQPELPVEQFEAANGGPMYQSEPDQCCFHRKIVVLRRVLAEYDAWFSGIRRDQSPYRANAPIVGWDKKFGLVKISPLANWTKERVWKRIVDEKVPYNPLHDQGYPSVGCQPCTRPVAAGEHERAGRWTGTAKTECGLHTAD